MGANAQTTVQKFLSGAVLTAAQQNFSAATGVPVFATTVTRDAAFGGANKVLAEGQTCYLESTNVVQYYDGAAWATVGGVSDMAIFNEAQADSTDGGTFTSGSWVKRTLNTTVVNNIVGCSIASSVITLATGTYSVIGHAPNEKGNRHQVRLQNTTAATTIQAGSSEFCDATNGVQNRSFINSYFTLASSSNLEFQHRCQTTTTTSGLGVRSDFGIGSIYAVIQITKVA